MPCAAGTLMALEHRGQLNPPRVEQQNYKHDFSLQSRRTDDLLFDKMSDKDCNLPQ